MQTLGSKGSDTYTSTTDDRVDLSLRLVRGAEPLDIIQRIRKIAREHTEDAFVLAFHTRNVRGGKGERDLFDNMIAGLHEEHPALTRDLLDLVPEYGSWRDVFALLELATSGDGTPAMADRLMDIAITQLAADTAALAAGESSISLCAKWAPREGNELAVRMARRIFPNHTVHSARMAAYRRYVSALNSHLKTVETFMCADRWDEIKPATVPGRAGKIYKRAFLNLPKSKSEDGVRCAYNEKRAICAANFRAHYEKAKAGKAKVHGADTLFPHEIVKSAKELAADATDERNHLSAVWRSLVEKTRAGGGLGRAIMMSDFSGSMQSAGAAGDTPYWVSMALGILGSQASAGAFRGKMMTFDSTPTWHQFPIPEDGAPADLFDCLKTLSSHMSQGTSTDFQAAMELVLSTLKANRVRPGEEPESLIVLTDMNWDQACASNGASQYTGARYRHHVKTEEWQTHLDIIKESFRRAGEDMWGPGQGFTVPKIIVWNLAANPTDIHATADTPGVGFLSGWSATQFKVLQAEGPRQLTPLELLRVELDDAKYDRVRERVRAFLAPRIETGEVPNHANGWGATD